MSKIAAPLGLVAIGTAGLLFSGFTYKTYADEWLRTTQVPGCLRAATASLKKQAPQSGVEPHAALDGQTVFLSPAEDQVVRCVQGRAPELAKRFATAFAELDNDKRSELLLAIAKDTAQKSAEHDIEVKTSFMVATAALSAMKEHPPAKSALSEIEPLDACRFYSETKPCAKRPPYPMAMWLAGVPASLAFLGGAVGLVIAAVRKRRTRKMATPSAGSEATQAAV